MSPAERLATVSAALLMAAAAHAASEPHAIVYNGSTALPPGEGIACSPDREVKKQGLAAARLDYAIGRPRGRAQLTLEPGRCPVPAPGTARVWVKGDHSSNTLQFVFWQARAVTDPEGNLRYEDARDVWLPGVRLDFGDWRELTLDVKNLEKDRVLAWRGFTVEEAGHKEPRLTGTLWLDDLRLYPAAGPRPRAALRADVLGSRVLVDATNLAVAVDLRNFAGEPLRVKGRLSVTDRNEVPVSDRSEDLTLQPGEERELTLELAPDRFAAYLPPFRVRGDLLAPDYPELAVSLDAAVAFGNAWLLFEPFADAAGGWDTRSLDDGGSRVLTVSERYRFSGAVDAGTRARRVEIGPAAAGEPVPPGRYALRVEFDGNGGVFNVREPRQRYLPGDAFRAGVWVRGDGSGARLLAVVHDFSDMADFYEGGWKRATDERLLATLDFTGWRYVEIPLPGNGIGTHLPKGSTYGVDFPLELAAFRMDAGERRRSRRDPTVVAQGVRGAVEIGPVFVHTQCRPAEALAVFLGSDDPGHAWSAGQGAWAVVQNGLTQAGRNVELVWSLLDRADAPVATGKAVLALRARELQTVRVDLAAHAAAIGRAAGPLRLQAVVADAADPAASATAELVLSKPDSRALVADFEEERVYPPFEPEGLRGAGAGGPAATSEQAAHSGRRSLALEWNREKAGVRVVSVDPPVPGVPVALRVWVQGDGSGALFYPLIGDRSGVSKGATRGQWDLFFGRTADAAEAQAVTVDWTGWRELRFRLPPVPPTWNVDLPVWSFVPSYPLGIHLVVLAPDGGPERGTLYVDDVSVETHLLPAQRTGLALIRPSETDVMPPPGEAAVQVWNRDATAARTVTLTGGAWDWRGRCVAGGTNTLTLQPGETRRVPVAGGVPAGAYRVSVALSEGGEERAREEADLVVADLRPWLGETWRQALQDDWRLRGPVGSRFEVVDEDWDWLEPQPGNFQALTAIGRARRSRERGGEPHALLGYSAYWAAGPGYEGRKGDAFERRLRDVGHGMDIFLVPERMADWDHYVCELMRAAGPEVSGWVLWDNPDGSGPLAMEPGHFAQFLQTADRWRRVYSPDKPLLIGGLQRETATEYLAALGRTNALGWCSGAHVRLDLGRLSPEDAHLARYVHELQGALATTGAAKRIVLTDVDWAVEKGLDGLGAFDQAAYLARTCLILDRLGLQPNVSVANVDYDRLGLGLVYRESRRCPPTGWKPQPLLLKPAWLALARVLSWRREAESGTDVPVQDLWSGRSRCLLQRAGDGALFAVVWRNDDPGLASFAGTGLQVTAAEDVFGMALAAENGEWPIGRVPVRFALRVGDEPAAQALRRLRVRDADAAAAWPQQVLAAFGADRGGPNGYAASGGEKAVLAGHTVDGEECEEPGLRFAAGGRESFRVAVPAGAGVVLRKRYLLDEAGHAMELAVNGKPAGRWDLRRLEKELAGGVREAVFVLDAARLAGSAEMAVEVTYPTGGNTVEWQAFEYRGGPFPLAAVGALHAEQNVGLPRASRNAVGEPLRVGDQRFAAGYGCFARSLQEFALNGQFRRFRATVGVDAATEGKGSVVFEVLADGRRVWNSPVMSGLDAPREVDVAVADVQRLRLVVHDGGDGNRFDAADWCEPTLE